MNVPINNVSICAKSQVYVIKKKAAAKWTALTDTAAGRK